MVLFFLLYFLCLICFEFGLYEQADQGGADNEERPNCVIF